MKITLSFEETSSDDVSIMVDVLRASSTMTMGLEKFSLIIPCFSPQEAFELKKQTGGIIAGERGGAKIEGFDIGNSPLDIRDYDAESEILILTTSNGTRILQNMTSKVLIGCINNTKSVAEAALELANEHVDVVMAGVRGEFAIDDYLAAGVILNEIKERCGDCEISEYAQSAILASNDYDLLKKAFRNSRSSRRLTQLGYEGDVEYCLKKNSTAKVGIYEKNRITQLNLNIK